MSVHKELQKNIEHLFDNRAELKSQTNKAHVERAVDLLSQGKIRVASPDDSGKWLVHDWVKKAILLYFSVRSMEPMDAGVFEFFDKIPLKTRLSQPDVRSVPGAIIRHGSHIEAGAILMPSFINIGAYVGTGSMVDTWATVGSCAQIGKHVHLSGGVGIGGVLEPPQASPVIIEDHAFVGSRCIVVEGVHVGEGAVLGAGLVLTASTKIIDVSGNTPVEHSAYIPPRSVVIPGTRNKTFPAGEYGIPAALIIGKRKKSTDEKVSLNDALRDYQIAV